MDDSNLKRLYALQKEDPFRVAIGNICLHCDKYFDVPMDLGRAILKGNPSISLNTHCAPCYNSYLVLSERKRYVTEYRKTRGSTKAGFFQRLLKSLSRRKI